MLVVKIYFDFTIFLSKECMYLTPPLVHIHSKAGKEYFHFFVAWSAVAKTHHFSARNCFLFEAQRLKG